MSLHQNSNGIKKIIIILNKNWKRKQNPTSSDKANCIRTTTYWRCVRKKIEKLKIKIKKKIVCRPFSVLKP